MTFVDSYDQSYGEVSYGSISRWRASIESDQESLPNNPLDAEDSVALKKGESSQLTQYCNSLPPPRDTVPIFTDEAGPLSEAAVFDFNPESGARITEWYHTLQNVGTATRDEKELQFLVGGDGVHGAAIPPGEHLLYVGIKTQCACIGFCQVVVFNAEPGGRYRLELRAFDGFREGPKLYILDTRRCAEAQVQLVDSLGNFSGYRSEKDVLDHDVDTERVKPKGDTLDVFEFGVVEEFYLSRAFFHR